jgi:hypothetical protein
MRGLRPHAEGAPVADAVIEADLLYSIRCHCSPLVCMPSLA